MKQAPGLVQVAGAQRPLHKAAGLPVWCGCHTGHLLSFRTGVPSLFGAAKDFCFLSFVGLLFVFELSHMI